MSTTAPAITVADLQRIELEDEARRARLSAPDALANAAAWYAAVGWPVFPLKPAGKTPLTRNGFKDASTDLEQVRAWWTTTPQANIGTPTGIRFDVIDVDGVDGFFSLAELRHDACPPDCCAERVCPGSTSHILGLEILAKSYTGGHGRHILIPPTGQRNDAGLLPGIDYRGAGGYIVLPPSRHETGNLYDWVIPPTPPLVDQAVT